MINSLSINQSKFVLFLFIIFPLEGLAIDLLPPETGDLVDLQASEATFLQEALLPLEHLLDMKTEDHSKNIWTLLHWEIAWEIHTGEIRMQEIIGQEVP